MKQHMFNVSKECIKTTAKSDCSFYPVRGVLFLAQNDLISYSHIISFFGKYRIHFLVDNKLFCHNASSVQCWKYPKSHEPILHSNWFKGCRGFCRQWEVVFRGFWQDNSGFSKMVFNGKWHDMIWCVSTNQRRNIAKFHINICSKYLWINSIGFCHCRYMHVSNKIPFVCSLFYFLFWVRGLFSPQLSLSLRWCKGRLGEQRGCMHGVLIPEWQSSSSNAWTHHWEKRKKVVPIFFSIPLIMKKIYTWKWRLSA